MKRIYGALPALVLLTATSADQAFTIQPGTWSVRTDITDIQMPGAPPMLASIMKKRPLTWKGCITPAEAAKGPPLGTFSRAGCTVTQKMAANGIFTSHSVCPQPGGGVGTVDVSGCHTGTSFTATANSVQTGKQPMTMQLKMSGSRTGGLLMRRSLILAAAALAATSMPAAAQKAKVDASKSSKVLAALPRSAAEARPVVAIYEVRSAVAEIPPKAATDMFMTALIKSGAFQVAERTRLEEGAGRERALMAAGKTAIAVATGEPAPAAMLPYSAARYVFEVVISEANVGARKHDNAFALGGAELSSKGASDEIGLDIRVTDVATGLVVDAVNTTAAIKASAKQVSGLNSLANRLLSKAGGGSVPLGADARFSSARQQGVDRAVRACIEMGVAELVRRIPRAS